MTTIDIAYRLQKKERALFFLERTLVGNGSEPFNGVFAVRLKGIVKRDALNMALSKVQSKYPQLQMAIAGIDSAEPYFFIPEQIKPIPLVWKEQMDDQQWQQEVLFGLRHRFDVQDGPMMRLTCLSSESYHDLILSFHHCICDGGGGIILIKELLRLLDQPTLDIGNPDQLLKKEDIIPEEIRNSRSIRLKTSLLAGVLKSVLALSAAFISNKNRLIFDRKRDYLFHLKLDTSCTKKWIKTCKEHQVTVNTALGLLLLQAYKTVLGSEAKNKVSCPVDIRRFASQIKDDQLFSFGLLLTLSQAKHRGYFWEDASILQKAVDKQTKRLKPYEFLMTFEKLHRSLSHMFKMLTYGKVGNDLMFSNVGKIPLKNTYDTFELETVFSPTVIGPFANPSTLICSTFKDQLDFSFVSNEGFLSKNKAIKIMDFMHQQIASLSDRT